MTANKMWCLFVFVCVLTIVTGRTTNVDQCQVFSGELPYNTHIEGCVNPPCLLSQLQDVVVHIVFRAPRTMTDMRTLATAFVATGPIVLPVPYPLGDDAYTCNFLTNSFCPVLAGEVLAYTLSMHIESFFPVDTVATLELRIVDENNDIVVCIRVGIRIMPPNRVAGDTTKRLLH